MFRRTRFNKILFSNARTIENELFDLKFVLIFCQFTQNEKINYEQIFKRLMLKLLIKNKNKRFT